MWGGKRASARYEGVDKPEQVDLCLNHCPFPDRCHHECCPYFAREQKRWPERDQFLGLYDKGLTDGELAHKFGKSKGTIQRWRRNCGLEPNKKKLPRDPCLDCNEISRKACKEMRCTCNEKARWQDEVLGKCLI